MDKLPALNLACPLDRLALEHRAGQLMCPRGHCYDQASRGYVNLLPVQFKRSREPGDSQAMISARKRFLDNGAYQPIARQLTELSLAAGSQGRCVCILDAGCGEGYYLHQVLANRQILQSRQQYSFIGVDISKPAIIAAAGRTKEITWVVGANRHMPVLPGTVDLLSCIFCPYKLTDFSDLLTSQGRIVLVEAGERHLIELRRALYPKLDPPSDPADFYSSVFNAGLRVAECQTLSFALPALGGQLLRDLLAMTPHYYRANPQLREQVLATTLDLSAEVVFTVLEADPSRRRVKPTA